MPQFAFQARDSTGKLVEGNVEANDRAQAIRMVEANRCVPVKIGLAAPASSPKKKSEPTPAPVAEKPAAKPVPEKTAPSATVKEEPVRVTAPKSTSNLSHKHKLLFSEQLAHLLTAGMTLDEALATLIRRLKAPPLQALTRSLHQALVEGRSLSQAMREYPRIFSPLYISMVAAGEASGTLQNILRRLVTYLTAIRDMADRIRLALVYPALLVVAGIGLVILFITFMVPQLTSFFKETGGKLPMATQMLIDVHALITNWWWLAILAVIALFTAFKGIVSTPGGRFAWDRMRLSFPGYGSLLRHHFYSQFARTLGTLLENGVTLLRSLQLLEDISGNTYIKEKLKAVQQSVIDGAPLSKALDRQNLFPEMFIDMLAVGEQTGKLSETMQLIADGYEHELDKQVKFVTALIPPIVIVFVAGIVGVLVFSILSAVFDITKGLNTRVR